MPQFQAVGLVVHLPDRSHLRYVKLGATVGLAGKGGQLGGGEVVQIGVHHKDRPLLVGHIPHGIQAVGRQLGEHLGGHEAAVGGQSPGNGLSCGAAVLFVSRAYIVHTLLTTLIRLLKNRSCTRARP